MLEAVELDSATWVVGTQWHPEDDAATDPEQQNVFGRVSSASRSPPISRRAVMSSRQPSTR